MKQKANLTVLLSAVIVMFSFICGTALAKSTSPTQPLVCGGLTGTWHGEQPGDMSWLALHTSDGLDPAKGEMVMNWIDTQFLGSDVTLNPGHGVWQYNRDGKYFNYTWYAFGTAYGQTMTLRASGMAVFEQVDEETYDCNKVLIYYLLDYFVPAVPVGGWDSAFLAGSEEGSAVQLRVPLVVPPLPE